MDEDGDKGRYKRRPRRAPPWTKGDAKSGTVTRPIVTVIGGGIAGLTAAHELAERGYNVQLVEAGEPTEGARSFSGEGIEEKDRARAYRAWQRKQGFKRPPRSGDRRSQGPCVPEVEVGGLARTQWVLLPGQPSGDEIPLCVPVPATPVDELLNVDGIDPWAQELATHVGHAVRSHASRNERGHLVNVSVRFNPRAESWRELASEDERFESDGWRKKITAHLTKKIGDWLDPWKDYIDLKVSAGRGDGEHGEFDLYGTATWVNVIPGEHGYRFFPSFYHNMFDIMRRTPIMRLEAFQEGRDVAHRLLAARRSVFDSLVAVPEMRLALGDGGPPMRVRRRLPRDLSEAVEQVFDVITRLKYTYRDSVRYTYRLLKWATASGPRRQQWATPADEEDADILKRRPECVRDPCYDGTWWAFIQGERFSKGFQTQLTASSQTLLAMSEREIDARTYGNISFQLLMDHLGWGAEVDRMLDGPTSEVWFEPWLEYLKRLGVRVFRGKLTKLELRDGELLPTFDPASPQSVDGDDVFNKPFGGGEQHPSDPVDDARPETELFTLPTAYVLAVPLETTFDLVRAATGEWKGRAPGLRALKAWWGHLEKDGSWEQIRDRGPFHPNGYEHVDGKPKDNRAPFRSLPGVQFFFEDHLQLARFHYYMPNSPWRLAGISHGQLWHEKTRRVRGVFSLDIGAVHAPDVNGKRAWEVGRKELVARVWQQFLDARKHGAQASNRGIPDPIAAHVDDFLDYDYPETKIAKNRAPYLVNLPRDWARRPGGKLSRGVEQIEYDVDFGRWVLGGSYMRTWTRLTTMESACEAGKHAANAVIKHVNAGDVTRANEDGRWGMGLDDGTPVTVLNLESREFSDLDVLKEIDGELLQRGMPHLFDILDLDAIVDDLLVEDDAATVVDAFRAVIERRLRPARPFLDDLSAAPAHGLRVLWRRMEDMVASRASRLPEDVLRRILSALGRS
jgi:uncharacterized protein with NAD-binding domain and iron-sulfur cluster